MKFLSKATLGLIAGATMLTAAAPAEAQYRRYYHRDRGGDTAAAAIIGGIAGLAIGSAIASDRRRDRYYDDRYYYDRGYDRRGYYDNYRGYYDRPYYRSGYRDYYAPRRGWGRRCVTQWQYDPYIGRDVRVRYC